MSMQAKAVLQRKQSTIRNLLQKHGTNVVLNDNDPTGDGDQSPIHLNDAAKQVYRDLFAEGGDLFECASAGHLSLFGAACISGHAQKVENMLHQAAAASGSSSEDDDSLPNAPAFPNQELVRLLETRETSMRLSPLLMVVSMGKNVQPQSPELERNQVQVAELLLKYGARPDARDVCGKTVCHYGAGQMATKEMTLKVVDMCITAAESCYLFGKEVELFGLANEEMNGKRGVGRGFHADTGRRAVYLYDQKKQVAVKPENIRLLSQEPLASGKNQTKLCDVQDRLGGVCLLEVLMTSRDDVATFLLDKHNAAIDIADWDGCSPKSMALHPGAHLMTPVAKQVKKHATSLARAEKKATSRLCTYCRAAETSERKLLVCAKCMTVQYCSRPCQVAHWKEGHKSVCKKAAQELEESILLTEPPQEAGGMVMMTIGGSGRSPSSGTFRKPDNIAVGQKFDLKIQAAGPQTPLLIYDKTRQCQFSYKPGLPGFDRMYSKVLAEPTFNGKKTYMAASFDESGNLTVYPGETSLKKW